jgi:DNA polymerase elongation subunit (family B)
MKMFNRKKLINYLVENKGRNGKSWSEILIELDIHVSPRNRKDASDTWRHYKKRNKHVKLYNSNNLPNILVFDIETAPLKSYIWSLWNNDIRNHDMLLTSEWLMLSWSAKWLHSGVIVNASLTPDEIKKEDDKRVTQRLWEMLNVADIVVAHNGDKFDIKVLNGRFIKHGILPPAPYKSIDTLKVLKRKFKIPSNKLDYACKFLGIEGKLSTGGFELWKDFLNGDINAINKMLKYNDNDIVILEKLYLKLLPWIPNHPNINIITESTDKSCPACGSNNLKSNGHHITGTSKFQVHQCNNCGHQARERKNSFVNKNLKSL